MQETYVKDEIYKHNDFTQNPLPKGEYEDCTFNNCDFANNPLSEIKFINCDFNGCNLSLAILDGTAFQNVSFKDCKMLGLRFDACNGFGFSVSFDNCQLNHSSFFKTKIKKTVFRDSQLEETDFSNADLTLARFDNCNLSHAVFNHSILEKTDFRSSFNYIIDPEANRIKKAKFSIQDIAGLLRKYNIEIEK